ncbi:CubicO group peptidase, beta-lactamase class C family [Pedobacter suwonensis]|uniref:CubicO group peptidase, beta-lactamase class C family n=1 Tax=Pedobacter suwonensis TaxID=332999 RepID=A0A1I0TQR3_9SPHI|nr:serine hydrolase [Pedobacter suwonensis]SFA54104.1 CubicO group peptidase, beta-lactamase class C family [Pedobacter suwonensis]
MKRILNVLLLCFLVLSSLAQSKKQKNDDPLAGIDTLFNRILKDQVAAGFSVAVVKGDDIIYSKGFGYRDVENKKPVTPNTLFAIGSSSKAFTGSLLGLLRKEGKLTFEDKAVSLLPKLHFYSEEMDSQIILRDLMAHRTGLSRYDFSWLLFNTANRDSIIARVKYMKPSAAVREKWFYNNFMYLAQGMIVERLTGKTWEQNIKEKFFIPLEMNRSNTDIKAFKEDSDASLPYTVAKGNEIKKVDYYNINGMGPAGSINSSANDMANWLKVWVSGGFFKKKEILPTDYVREAASSQMVMSADLPAEHNDIFLANYGLGWMIGSYRGHYMVEHGGNINGFSANVAFLPSDQLGIVVLSNQNGSQVPAVVRNSIVDRLLNLKTIDWNGEAMKKIKANMQVTKGTKSTPILNTIPSHPLKDYVGSFENPAYGTIKVWQEKNELYTLLSDEKVLLKHMHYDVFDPKSIDKNGVVDTVQSNLMFNFSGGVDGKIQGIGIFLDGSDKPVMFDFKPEAKILSLKELQKYTGEYALGQITVKVYLKGNTLMVHVPGQQEYETIATEADTFNLKALKGFSVKFDVAADKQVNAVSFIQPNGIFKAMKEE